MTPDCMTPDELRAWHAANAVLRDPAGSACWDCPVAFSEEMRGIGRCNGTPGAPAPRPVRRLGTRERNRLAAQRWRDRQRELLTAAVSA